MSESSPPPATRRGSPTPVETTVRKKVRQFAAEPGLTTAAGSSRQDEVKENQHHAAMDTREASPSSPPKRRWAPQPVETTFKSNRQPRPRPTLDPTPTPTPTPRRKFEPELIETSKRSKKAGDTRPATLPTDKTDLTPGVPNIYTRPRRKSRPSAVPLPPDHPPTAGAAPRQNLPPLPPRRQQSMRPHPNTRRSTRQSSFHPELEAIASYGEPDEEEAEDEGEGEGEGDDDEEGTPSLSASLGSSEDSMMKRQLARTRESCDERFSGYLLALAAKAAEKQLREQALAAFPNESMHHIVEHFYDREIEGASDEDSVEGVGLLVIDDPKLDTLRRKSTEVGWAAKEMQQHQAKLDRLREGDTHAQIAAEASPPPFQDAFWTNGRTGKNAALARAPDEPFDKQKEAELKRMRSAASPPMLGADLQFRMCPSPQATKFESDQRIDVQRPNRSENGGGLWGGYCIADEPGEFLSLSKQPALIHTPHPQGSGDVDPFSSAFSRAGPADAAKTAPRPAGGARMLTGLDDRLQAEVAKAKEEAALREEFDDTFVTQVYNYLSLGYPALARNYDEELARIARVSIDELRAEDTTKDVKGYIGIGEGVEKEHGPRWMALRVYILEWARQHPSMSNGATNPWGAGVRRGSWAI